MWMKSQEERRADPIRQGVGLRLKAARENKGLIQQEVADKFAVTKATVSAWEKGTGDPGVYRLRELCKLYDVAADALLWEDSLSPDAMKLAAEFDGLTERQKSTLRALWLAYIAQSTLDEAVEAKMPITKAMGRHHA